MARYAALLKLPLAACFVLSLDGLAARAEDGYPDYGPDPAATSPAEDAGQYEYEYGEHPSNGPAALEEGAMDDLDQAAPLSDQAGQEEDANEVEVIRERFPNGSIHIEREVTQDADGNYINHGSWKMFDERGTIIAEGYYRNGERDGTWNRWYRAKEADLFAKAPYSQFTGPYVSQATFRNGRLDGKWAIYDSKQRKISEWSFANGARDGKSVLYFATGHKMQEIDYHAGEIDGQYNEWNADGRQTVKDTYKAGRKLGTKVEYFANKQKKTEGMYLHAKEIEQTPDDWWTVKLATYTKQGKDEKHGVWVSWYQSGQKQMQGEYRNDLQVGKFEWWYENGQIALRGKYDSGKQVGKWTWWHPNGQKSTQGEYADGNPTGRWRWWDTNGRVHETADLSHGDTKVVDVPMSIPHKAEVPTTHPTAPKLQGKIKR
ncbi:MAG TPA: toxin-antitoxin system YwqK family antitoxin [Pirellulales bacterium]|nr:toxin-antitoxin system YwqK family antitoxin [Pirellulales bacterium]